MRIQRAIFKNNEEKPGYCTLVRYCSYKEVSESFFAVLKGSSSVTEPDSSLLGMAEYYNIDSSMEKSPDFEEPIGQDIWLKIICSHGSNEGIRVDLMAFSHSNGIIQARYIAGVKFLCDHSEAWAAARIAEEALQNGLDVIVD